MLAASLAAAGKLPFNYPKTVSTVGGTDKVKPPPGYVLDHARSRQRKFARQSHAHMRHIVADSVCSPALS